MKIKTAETLCDVLSEELVWRKKELTELKHAIEASELRIYSNRVLPRWGITALYAHWEGFIKIASTYFLEYLNFQNIKINKLTDNFITLILHDELIKKGQNSKASALHSITDFFMNKMDEKCNIRYKRRINMEGNLSSEVFKEIAWCLGVDYMLFAAYEKLIDARLLGVRNKVAHGDSFFVELDDYLELHDKIIELMIIYKNQLENAAAVKNYVKSP